MAVRETPEVIRRGLTEFHNELEKIPKDEKRTYEECLVRAMLYRDEEDSCYALHESFHLRFLRFELFDAGKAAKRFISYLEFVREFWGADIALKRLIRFSDFSKAEMKLFRKGYFQVLPFRDHAGRRILTLLGGFDPSVDPVMRAKVLFYLTDVLTRTDIESQQKGIVTISESYCWSTEDSYKRSKTSLRFPNPQEGVHYLKRLFDSMANRMVAIHNCWPDRPAFRIMSKLLTIHGLSQSEQRLRLKFHIGDELEMRYRLKSYGIPIELLPITDSGSIKMINHNYWIKTRKQIEQGIDTNVTILECPGSDDVVFRQGTSSMENPGNVKCRDLILSLLEDRDRSTAYNNIGTTTASNSSSIAAKIHNDIVDRLVDEIECHRFGRFLEWDKQRSTWIQMSDRQKVKQKVSVLLHSIDKRYRRTINNNNGNIIPSSTGPKQKRSSSIVSTSSQSSSLSASTSSNRNTRSPSVMIQQNLDAMAIKSDDETEDSTSFGNHRGGDVGPYAFLEGGTSVQQQQQQQCCRLGSDAFASHHEISRKRFKSDESMQN